MSVQPRLKALVLVGCEPEVMLSCSSRKGFSGYCGKIPPSRRWAVHMDDQLHPCADTVSQGRDCFPARSPSPWMGTVLHPSDWLQSTSPSAPRAKPWKFYGFGGETLRMGQHGGRWFPPPWKEWLPTEDLLHNRFYHVKELKRNSVSATLLCLFSSA